VQNSSKEIHFEFLNENDYPLWDSFVESSPQGTFFNSTRWAKLLSRIFERPFHIVVAKNDERIISGMLLFEHGRFGYRLSTNIPFYPYSGPLFAAPIDEKPQKTIARQLESGRTLAAFLAGNFAFYQFRSHFNYIDLRAFQWTGHKIQPHYTYLLPLSADGRQETRFSQSVRRKCKKAREQGAQIIESVDADTIANLYGLSYSHHGISPPVSETKIGALAREITGWPQACIRAVKINDSIKACRVIIKSGSSAFDCIAGSDHSDADAATWLLVRMLGELSNDCAQFDFLGAGHPQVEQFKRGFGGELKCGFEVENIPGFPLNALLKLQRYKTKKGRGL